MSAVRGSPAARAAARVRLLLMDVDGVLTDGRLSYFERAPGEIEELKAFDSQDGIALLWAHQAGIVTGVISGRSSAGVVHRAKLLKITHVVQGTYEKREAFERILAEEKCSREEAAFVGDDLTDLPVMRLCGLPVAVANARPEVRKAAKLVTRREGGRGAVREVIEMLLRAQGKWDAVLGRYE